MLHELHHRGFHRVRVVEHEHRRSVLHESVHEIDEPGLDVMHEGRFVDPVLGRAEQQPEPVHDLVALRAIAPALDELRQPPPCLLRRIAVLDPRELGDDGRDGGERRGVGVGPSRAVQDPDVGLESGHELVGEARLPDAALAEDRREDRTAGVRGPTEALAQDRELALAADERDGAADRAGREPFGGEGWEGAVETLGDDLAWLPVGDLRVRERVRRDPGQDLPGRGGGLQARRRIHHLTGHEQLPGGALTRGGLA